MDAVTTKLRFSESPVHFVKYMGSKSKIIEQVVHSIVDLEPNGTVCDLFAGSCTLSGVLGGTYTVASNDIQHYSATLARAYLTDWRAANESVTVKKIIDGAKRYFDRHYAELVESYTYEKGMSVAKFQRIDKSNLSLIKKEFNNEWHLFTKNYSGTWWSATQCAWIDSLRQQIERHVDTPFYSTMLASLMFAMAYTSQGTGHFAQYRDAKTDSAKKDIEIYRTRELVPYFERKLNEAFAELPTAPSTLNHHVTTLDYEECLRNVRPQTVYADPPYCFVHYSRFYHALESYCRKLCLMGS